MTRKRPAQTPPEEPGGEEPKEKKYSLLVPTEIDEKLGQIMRQRRVKLSLLIREIISDNIDDYLNEAYGREEFDELGFSLRSPLEVCVPISKEIRYVLAEVARDMNMKAGTVVQLLLSRYLPTLVEEGKELRKKMQSVLADMPRPHEDAGQKKDDGDADRRARPKK
jgi:hypothetical protein